MNKTTTQRYESLDILRGFCALSIMIYHYSGWTFRRYDASDVIGRFGVYGVSMFYVLSGLTMYLVYFRNFSFDWQFVKSFFTKRFFRIYPLMLFTLISCYFIFGTENSMSDQLLVGTGLFSVVKWDANTPTGMWSIGNELSFYLMLPFMFYALKKGKLSSWLASLVIFGLYFYFAFFLLNTLAETSLEDYYYKNPFNQAGLFLGGILVGHLFKERVFTNAAAIVVLVLATGLFCFYPSSGELRNVYVGWERVVYTLICFAFTFGAFKISLNTIPEIVKKPFVWMGEISYSLYLLHPHIFVFLASTGMKIRFVLPLSVLLTFTISWLVYKMVESPARNLGYRLTSQRENLKKLNAKTQ